MIKMNREQIKKLINVIITEIDCSEVHHFVDNRLIDVVEKYLTDIDTPSEDEVLFSGVRIVPLQEALALPPVTTQREKNVREAVLSYIDNNPQVSIIVRNQLIKEGYKDQDVRNAITHLWDEGFLNVGTDQKLYIVK